MDCDESLHRQSWSLKEETSWLRWSPRLFPRTTWLPFLLFSEMPWQLSNGLPCVYFIPAVHQGCAPQCHIWGNVFDVTWVMFLISAHSTWKEEHISEITCCSNIVLTLQHTKVTKLYHMLDIICYWPHVISQQTGHPYCTCQNCWALPFSDLFSNRTNRSITEEALLALNKHTVINSDVYPH